MTDVLDFENLTKKEEARLRAGIDLLPFEQRESALKLPLSFAAFLYPEFVQYGPRFYLWRDAMNSLERQLTGADADYVNVDLLDTYYVNNLHAGVIANHESKNWRKSNLIHKLPPNPKKDIFQERVYTLGNLFDGDDKIGYEIFNLFSTFMLGEDFLAAYAVESSRYNDYYSYRTSGYGLDRGTTTLGIERLGDALAEHRDFCLRHGIDY